ncbi:MAG: hypothetical protein AAFQ82_05660 [Myxococcota bacterium]
MEIGLNQMAAWSAEIRRALKLAEDTSLEIRFADDGLKLELTRPGRVGVTLSFTWAGLANAMKVKVDSWSDQTLDALSHFQASADYTT